MDEPDEKRVITPAYAEMLLTKAFPGAEMTKGDAVGRKATMTVRFGEFSVAIYCPRDPRMKVYTTFTFRRRVSGKTIYRVNEQFEHTQLSELAQTVRQARGYVFGIYIALHTVLEEPVSPLADILGGI